MEDAAIVSLYWQRDEAAIQETKTKYGAYLGKVAWNILGNQEDCEESVSDTYLRAWESMPPQRPSLLSAYLAKLTRQLSRTLVSDRMINTIPSAKTARSARGASMPFPSPSWRTAFPAGTPPARR